MDTSVVEAALAKLDGDGAISAATGSASSNQHAPPVDISQDDTIPLPSNQSARSSSRRARAEAMPVDISKDDTVVMKKGPAKPEDISKDDTVVMKKALAKPEDISKDDTVVLKKAPAKPVDISKDDTNVIKEAPVGISKENTAAKTKTSSAAAATKSTAAPKAAEPATPSPDNTEVLIKQPVVPSSAGAVSSSVPTSSSRGEHCLASASGTLEGRWSCSAEDPPSVCHDQTAWTRQQARRWQVRRRSEGGSGQAGRRRLR